MATAFGKWSSIRTAISWRAGMPPVGSLSARVLIGSGVQAMQRLCQQVPTGLALRNPGGMTCGSTCYHASRPPAVPLGSIAVTPVPAAFASPVGRTSMLWLDG